MVEPSKTPKIEIRSLSSPGEGESSQSGSVSNFEVISAVTPNGNGTDGNPPNPHIPKDPKAPLNKNQFINLTGMNLPIDASGPKSSESQKSPYGTLYTDVNNEYGTTKAKFIAYEVGAYGLLGLQLLLSAVFVILGSLKDVDSHIAIVVLGAVSTVIAGILAFMKGQGQPNRLRQKTVELGNVLQQLKSTYRDFEFLTFTFEDFKRLEQSYEDVIKESNQNHPDFWTVLRSQPAVSKLPDAAAAEA